jgi:hypothetical protein
MATFFDHGDSWKFKHSTKSWPCASPDVQVGYISFTAERAGRTMLLEQQRRLEKGGQGFVLHVCNEHIPKGVRNCI